MFIILLKYIVETKKGITYSYLKRIAEGPKNH